MPIHDVGYRHWDGTFGNVFLRWLVIAGAGVRLVWKSHWLRRMLFFAWMPAAVTGVGFFVYEQAVEHADWQRAGKQLIQLYPEPQPVAEPGRPDVVSYEHLLELIDASREGGSGQITYKEFRQGQEEDIQLSDLNDLIVGERVVRGRVTRFWPSLVKSRSNPQEVLFETCKSDASLLQEEVVEKLRATNINWYPVRPSLVQQVAETFDKNPADARHQVWSMLLLAFFRYPQGLLMVLLVGMIAPSLISVDLRSRAYLLYFSRPITPVEYILGKALVVWAYLAAVTTLPALVLYVLGVLLSPSLSVFLYTWDLPFRILAASLVLMLPTTSLALFFSSMTTESRYAGFSWFALWALGWTAYANLNVVHPSPKWGMLSLYHVLGRVQEWVFGLAPQGHDAVPCAILLAIVTVMPFVVLASRVVAPMRV